MFGDGAIQIRALAHRIEGLHASHRGRSHNLHACMSTTRIRRNAFDLRHTGYVPDQGSPQLARFGHPWPSIALLALPTGSFIFFLIMGVYLLGATGPNSSAPHVTGLFFIFLAVPYLIFYAVLLAHPSRFWRVVVVRPMEVSLPDPKWRHVPINDITGVALVKIVRVRGRKAGVWTPMFWRRDGSKVTVGGLGFVTSATDPSLTEEALLVKDVFEEIHRYQGPAGPLETVAAQKNPDFSPYSYYDQVWDPSVSEVNANRDSVHWYSDLGENQSTLSKPRAIVLQVCGAIDLASGLFLLIAGVGFAAALALHGTSAFHGSDGNPVLFAIIFLVLGPLITWCGVIMIRRARVGRPHAGGLEGLLHDPVLAFEAHPIITARSKWRLVALTASLSFVGLVVLAGITHPHGGVDTALGIAAWLLILILIVAGVRSRIGTVRLKRLVRGRTANGPCQGSVKPSSITKAPSQD